MQQNVLKKPTLVLMAGLPGVGKTTLATELGQRLGWAVLERDLLKEPFLEVPWLKEKFDEDSAGWAAYECSLNFTEQFLVNHKLSVILDTALLHPFILERAKKLVARSGARLKIILCEVDEPTRQQRLCQREKRISQSSAHLVSQDKAKQFEQLDPLSYKKIGTQRPLKAYIEEALTYVTEQEQRTPTFQCASTQLNIFDILLLYSSENCPMVQVLEEIARFTPSYLTHRAIALLLLYFLGIDPMVPASSYWQMAYLFSFCYHTMAG